MVESVKNKINPSRTYRSDIDGLRAISVSLVLLYHVGGFIPAGYVGVDVFFVISGFLITQLVLDEMVNREFSFSNFYMRRVRRLAPALLFTLVLSSIVACSLLLPEDLEEFSGSAISAILSLSNFFFWQEAGYFDSAASTKPLLHTWSLSVEEQFYFIWPLLIFLVFRKGLESQLLIIFSAIIVISLILNLVYEANQDALFYLLPFRAFELAIGAAIVFFLPHPPKNALQSDLICLVGLFAIGASAIGFSSDTVWPHMNALLPCLGAACVIYAGGSANWVQVLLCRAPLVFIGKISYSLYLIHWPIVVFYQYWVFDDLNGFDLFLVYVLSFGIASMMYFWVEQPFRKASPDCNKRILAGVGLAASLLVAPAVHILEDGWSWRMPQIAEYEMHHQEQRAVWAKDSEKDRCWADEHSLIDLEKCITLASDRPNILVAGDSHAAHFLPGLRAYFDEANVSLIAGNSCALVLNIVTEKRPACRQILDYLSESAQLPNFDLIILAGRKIAGGSDNYSEFFDLAQRVQSKTNTLILGPVHHYRRPQDDIFRHFISLSLEDREQVMDKYLDEDFFKIDKTLDEFSSALGFEYVSIISGLCDERRSNCMNFEKDGFPIKIDASHVAREASFIAIQNAFANRQEAIPEALKKSTDPNFTAQ